jgi:uncharacterized protein YjbJ (UPF0337 family)
MDDLRSKGTIDQAKGDAKVAIGKVTGDEMLQADGKIDKAKGKVESAVGAAGRVLRDLRDN